MENALAQVVDAIDLETYLYCASPEEARKLALSLAQELKLPAADVVFLEHHGWGARVRIRSYIHHPGDHYLWLPEE